MNNMVFFSINLPAKYRFDIKLTKKRKRSKDKPLFPSMGKVLRAKAGSKFSRFFRLIFENDQIKKVIGLNIALFLSISSLLPNTYAETEESEINSINTPIILTTQSGVQYPVKTVRITTPYRFYHPGIDFDGLTGDPVYPVMAGKVESTGYSRFGYGNNVIIDHGSGTTSLYAHLSKINVKEGDSVNLETVIGEMGATGRSFGDHLHLEVTENEKTINPQIILSY